MAGTDDDAALPPGHDQLLELSDERDQWQRHGAAMWHHGYEAGHADGHATGHREGYEQAVREWKVTATGLDLAGTPFKELDKTRYPPGGRLSWLTPTSDSDDAA